MSEERSSAAMLAPALLMVLLALAAVAVDLSLVHAARRSAYRSLSAAVDDAASMVDSRHLLATGEVRLDRVAARRVALVHLGLLGEPPDGFSAPTFEFVGEPRILFDTNGGDGLPGGSAAGTSVVIHATVRVDHIVLSALPGMDDSMDLAMTTTARMVTDADGR